MKNRDKMRLKLMKIFNNEFEFCYTFKKFRKNDFIECDNAYVLLNAIY